jgi:hypothetical protein
MAITALPVLNRTSPTFRAELDDFFTNKLPAFSVEANDVALGMELNATSGASITPKTIGTGAISLVADANKGWLPGMTIKVASTASPTNWMVGDVTAYNVSTGGLTVDCQLTNGGGAFAAWTISFASIANNGVTQAAGDSSIKLATTEWVRERGIGVTFMWAGDTLPDDCIDCPTAPTLLSKTGIYAKLFSKLQYLWGGSGDDFGIPWILPDTVFVQQGVGAVGTSTEGKQWTTSSYPFAYSGPGGFYGGTIPDTNFPAGTRIRYVTRYK